MGCKGILKLDVCEPLGDRCPAQGPADLSVRRVAPLFRSKLDPDAES
jgi:hypothetical protein